MNWLIWMGNKKRLLPQIRKFYPKQINNYYEPFLGSGSVYFDLLQNKLVTANKSKLGDINLDLISAYLGVRDDLSNVHAEYSLLRCMHSEAYYRLVRRKTKFTIYERGARFLYLNRTAYAGLWRTNKKDGFNVPMRKTNVNWLEYTDLYVVSAALQESNITFTPYHLTISDSSEGDFIYLDPPYQSNVENNYNGFYGNNFTEVDQTELKNNLIAAHLRGTNFVLSNSDSELIWDLYDSIKGFYIYQIPVKYKPTQHSKPTQKTELIITNVLNHG